MIPVYTRHTDWWEHKITPLIATGLFAIYTSGETFQWLVLGKLGIILLGIVTGAIYVSVINDFTDMVDDLKAGKDNRLKNIPKPQIIAIIIFLLVTGVLFLVYILPDKKTAFFYLGAWIIYTLYSFPPMRLKNRGWLGVLADAFGAHVFPTLTILSCMEFALHVSFSTGLYLFFGIWTFLFGIRGILWHQFQDLVNDQLSNVKTFATTVDQRTIKKWELMVIFLEIMSFALIIWITGKYWIYLLVLFYLLFSWMSFVKSNRYPVLILCPPETTWHFLMASFYQTFLPISLLIALIAQNSRIAILLPIYAVLFPVDIRDNLFWMKSIFIKNG